MDDSWTTPTLISAHGNASALFIHMQKTYFSHRITAHKDAKISILTLAMSEASSFHQVPQLRNPSKLIKGLSIGSCRSSFTVCKVRNQWDRLWWQSNDRPVSRLGKFQRPPREDRANNAWRHPRIDSPPSWFAWEFDRHPNEPNRVTSCRLEYFHAR